MSALDTTPPAPTPDSPLRIERLSVEFDTADGVVHAVNDVDLSVRPGETLGIVGESGSGKSVTARAALRLVPAPGRITSGQVIVDGRDLTGSSDRTWRRVRGRSIALVSQDSLTAFNPVRTVGSQLKEAIRLHDRSCSAERARQRAIELLELVGVPDSARRFKEYPHQFSGGMRQRAAIGMAIAHEPAVLIADEPTTALDVTIQAQVLETLRTVQRAASSAIILITHDLSVIAEMADRVVVMYAGRVVEEAPVRELFHRPHHPYTVSLLGSLPRQDGKRERLIPIPGQPPSVIGLPEGCPFAPRCPLFQERDACVVERPELLQVSPGHHAACHFKEETGALRHKLQQAAKSSE